MLQVLRFLFDKMSSLFASRQNAGNTNFSLFGNATSVFVNTETQKKKTMKTVEKDTIQSVFPGYILPPRFVAFHNATTDMEGNSPLVNDVSDPGGLTAWGISSKANPDLSEEIKKGMKKDRAYQIAYERYYVVIPFIDSVDPQIGFVIYDSRFHGMKENIMVIQSYLNNVGFELAVDGVAGPKTMMAVSRMTSADVKFVLNQLTVNGKKLASLAAKRTISAQIKQSKVVRDYTEGFLNRQLRRLSYARTMEA